MVIIIQNVEIFRNTKDVDNLTKISNQFHQKLILIK